jgi:biopolymer transport protein ExbD
LLVNSSDVEVLQNNKTIKLPESVAEKRPENTLVVMVSKDDIVIGGRAIVSVSTAMNSKDAEISELAKELQYLASRKPFTSDLEKEKGRDVTIMGDAEIPYTLLKKIMTTCAKTEYRNISLAVSRIQEKQPDPAVGG